MAFETQQKHQIIGVANHPLQPTNNAKASTPYTNVPFIDCTVLS